MGKKIEAEQAKRRPFWIILAVIGAAWLVWQGFFGYTSYWTQYFLYDPAGTFKTFFDALIDVSAIYLVDFLAGCTFFALMVKGLERTAKPFAIIGLTASVVTAVLYIFGIKNAAREFVKQPLGFIHKFGQYSLFKYIAYAMILIGLAVFFLAAIKRRSMYKLSRVLIIVGALILMIISAVNIFGQGICFKNELCDFITQAVYFCFSYIAIAISVF